MADRIKQPKFILCFFLTNILDCQCSISLTNGDSQQPFQSSDAPYLDFKLEGLNSILEYYQHNFLVLAWCDNTIEFDSLPQYPMMFFTATDFKSVPKLEKLDTAVLYRKLAFLIVTTASPISQPTIQMVLYPLIPVLIQRRAKYTVETIIISPSKKDNLNRFGNYHKHEIAVYWFTAKILKPTKVIQIQSMHIVCSGDCRGYPFIFTEYCGEGDKNNYSLYLTRLKTQMSNFLVNNHTITEMITKFLTASGGDKYSLQDMVTQLNEILTVRRNTNRATPFPLSTQSWSLQTLCFNELFSPYLPNVEKLWEKGELKQNPMSIYNQWRGLAVKISSNFKLQNVEFTSPVVIVQSEPVNFLTCYGLKQNILFDDYIKSFDKYTWSFLLVFYSILTIIASIILTTKENLNFFFILPIVALEAYATLLNVHSFNLHQLTQHLGSKFAFKFLFLTWFFAAFLLNNAYQNLVISNVIKPLSVNSPWSSIDELEDFNKFVPLYDYIKDYDGLIQVLNVWKNKNPTRMSVRVKDLKNGRFKIYHCNDTMPVQDWVYKAPFTFFFSAIGNKLREEHEKGQLCPEVFKNNPIPRRRITVSPCPYIHKKLRSLRPAIKSRGMEIFGNISRCDAQNAYVDSSKYVNELYNFLNKGRNSKPFVKGVPESKYTQVLTWTFKYRYGGKDLFYERMKGILESGVYGFWERMTNPLKPSDMYKLKSQGLEHKETKDGEEGQKLASNIVSVFYIYLIGLAGSIAIFLIEICKRLSIWSYKLQFQPPQKVTLVVPFDNKY